MKEISWNKKYIPDCVYDYIRGEMIHTIHNIRDFVNDDDCIRAYIKLKELEKKHKPLTLKIPDFAQYMSWTDNKSRRILRRLIDLGIIDKRQMRNSVSQKLESNIITFLLDI